MAALGWNGNAVGLIANKKHDTIWYAISCRKYRPSQGKCGMFGSVMQCTTLPRMAKMVSCLIEGCNNDCTDSVNNVHCPLLSASTDNAITVTSNANWIRMEGRSRPCQWTSAQAVPQVAQSSIYRLIHRRPFVTVWCTVPGTPQSGIYSSLDHIV